jgi:hypothetical protein
MTMYVPTPTMRPRLICLSTLTLLGAWLAASPRFRFLLLLCGVIALAACDATESGNDFENDFEDVGWASA